MKEEFNLSEKRQDRKHPNHKKPFNSEFTYSEEDVKEFIRLLKEETWKDKDNEDIAFIWKVRLHEMIDKLAGEKLCQ